jgi:hypothetical protein
MGAKILTAFLLYQLFWSDHAKNYNVGILKTNRFLNSLS